MNGQKILIVDDEAINLELFDVMLSKLGFTVERAKNGMEGLEKTKRFSPDIILMDSIMPRMSGWELTRILKNDAKHKDIPIIMLTALDDVKDKVAAFEIGVDDYITKPFNFTEVLARIRALLRSRELYSQIVVRESRLSLAEELSADLLHNLADFVKTIDELDAAVEAINSKIETEADLQNKAKLLHTVSEKSQQVRKHVAELDARIEKTGEEWERIKKDEIGLSQLETRIRENPIQE